MHEAEPNLYLYLFSTGSRDIIMRFPVVLLAVVCLVQLTTALDLTQSIGRFSVNLFESILPSPQTSYILSPLSVLADLSMALLGAGGQTARELQLGLQLGTNTRQQTADAFRTFLQPLQQTTSELRVVNKIYVNQEFTVKPAYNALVAGSFFATAQSLDFGQPDVAAGTINSYVASQTNNLITNLVSASMLSQDTRMVLINAVYFKANWQHPFVKRSTYKEDFHTMGLAGVASVKKLDFMHATHQYLYTALPDLNAILVGLPYEGNRYVLNIILPNNVASAVGCRRNVVDASGLGPLLKRLHGKDLSQLSAGAIARKIELSLPKFTSRHKLSLKAPLQKLGIKTAFTDAADFSDLLERANHVGISEVVHEAYIKVDEKGTEAAAATAIVVGATNSVRRPDLEEILVVKINRPFAYYIQDANRHVIFYGQFVGI